MNTISINTHRFFLCLLSLACLAPMSASAGGAVSEFDVDGLKVILKHSPKEVIHVGLYVEGGTANYPKEMEGIEDLAFRLAIEGGTANQEKTDFHAAAQRMGTEFASMTTYDYGKIGMTCVKMFWDDSWDLFTDAVLNPSFGEAEFKLLQDQLVAAAGTRAADPDEHLRDIAMGSTFEGSSYARIPSGTPKSLKALTLDDLKSYYRQVMVKQRAFLVVVGDLTEAELRARVASSLARLPEGSPAQFEERQLIDQGGSFVEDRDIATNYIRGLMSAPTLDDEDGIATWVAMSILQDRLFNEIRTKRSLSYAPAAFYASSVLVNPYNVIYVSTVDPKQSMEVMVEEINKVKKEGFSEYELRNEQQSFLTRRYMQQQTTATQADALAAAEIVGSWKLAEELTERVNALTLEDLNRAFRNSTGNIRWTYLGKADMVKPEDFPQPERTLKVYDGKQ